MLECTASMPLRLAILVGLASATFAAGSAPAQDLSGNAPRLVDGLAPDCGSQVRDLPHRRPPGRGTVRPPSRASLLPLPTPGTVHLPPQNLPGAVAHRKGQHARGIPAFGDSSSGPARRTTGSAEAARRPGRRQRARIGGAGGSAGRDAQARRTLDLSAAMSQTPNLPEWVDAQRLQEVLGAVREQVATALWLSAGMVFAFAAIVGVALGWRRPALVAGLLSRRRLWRRHRDDARSLPQPLWGQCRGSPRPSPATARSLIPRPNHRPLTHG